ncbi:hypothetical protein ABZ215_24635 [Amycolatopsis sp. NPDC006131]|uniref:hypothetical protein n=1 Tax=Amycolatopsis sp. NPDC006131 TaxID=3156731 RepID=UPI0033B42A74
MTDEQIDYAPTLPGIAQMMKDADEGLFVDLVAELLEEIIREHAQTEDDNCKECSESWTIAWPCGWWATGERVAISWLMEKAAGVQRGPLQLPPEIAKRVADPLKVWRDRQQANLEPVHQLALEVLGLPAEPDETKK